MKKLKCLIFLFIIFLSMFNIAFAEPKENESTPIQYRKLDELKEELKEERKIIDQQRFEEIRLKELEKKENIKESDIEEKNDIKKEQEKHDNNKEEKNNIPSLIVRLRGKHTTKYLCSYNFTLKSENTENVLSNTIIDNYKTLLKKPSLKVRPGESINFEFSENPNSIIVYRWGEEEDTISLKKNSIKVPDKDEKIVIAIEGKYDNGQVKYAIVLDIRK